MKETYHDLLSQSCKDLTTKESKTAFQTVKRLTRYNPASKVFDPKTGPLLGKFSSRLKDLTLTKQSDIDEEIAAYLK